jgi:hypothetical protein
MPSINDARSAGESRGWVLVLAAIAVGLLIAMSRGVSIDVGVVNVGATAEGPAAPAHAAPPAIPTK